MSILDDAIREHLELKRAHGADEAELRRLEDEAFGPPGLPEEPDPFAEAPTEFIPAPEAAETAEPGEEGGRRRINVADLQEPPPEPEVEEPAAVEHEVVAEEPSEAGHSTTERQAIAEQPTELFDVEAEIGTEDAPASEAPSPSDEEIAEAEAAEPKLAPVEPATEIHASRAESAEESAEEEYEDDDFWSEQRLSDELDQALETPAEEEEEDFEEEDEREEHEPESGHEDVLEDTPDFLEDTPEDDELWFEQRPPKDFDFDD